jgi:hypothetical protein
MSISGLYPQFQGCMIERPYGLVPRTEELFHEISKEELLLCEVLVLASQ